MRFVPGVMYWIRKIERPDANHRQQQPAGFFEHESSRLVRCDGMQRINPSRDGGEQGHPDILQRSIEVAPEGIVGHFHAARGVDADHMAGHDKQDGKSAQGFDIGVFGRADRHCGGFHLFVCFDAKITIEAAKTTFLGYKLGDPGKRFIFVVD